MRLALLAFVAAAIFVVLAIAGVVRVTPRSSSPPAIVLPTVRPPRMPAHREPLRRQSVRLSVESARWQPR